jgi:hypothetical protein
VVNAKVIEIGKLKLKIEILKIEIGKIETGKLKIGKG